MTSKTKTKASTASRPWLITSSSVISSKRVDVKIVYPLILEASETVDDVYWKNMLVEAAKGKLPKGYNFENETTIIFRSGSKVRRLRLDSDPTMLSKDFISFVQISGERSQSDQANSQNEVNNSRVKFCIDELINDWNEVPKTQKSTFRQWYVEDMTKQYNLTSEQVAQLESLLAYGFLLRQIYPDDIIMDKGKIKEIRSIHYDQTLGVWSRDPRPSMAGKSSNNRRVTKPALSFQDGFSKWLKEFLASSGSAYTRSFHNSSKTTLSTH